MPHLSIFKNKKIVAGIMVFLMLFIMLFSTFFIAVEADHDCTGEDCPICTCIAQCENTLHQIGNGIAFQIAIILPIVVLLIFTFPLTSVFPQKPLVPLKVRLDG